MRAPVGEKTVAVIVEPPPAAAVAPAEAVGVKRRPGRLAEPAVPVEPFGNLLFREVVLGRRTSDAAEDLFDLADISGLNDWRQFAVIFHNPLTSARNDAVVLSCGLDYHPPFSECQSERFFGEDIFPRLAAVDDDLCVPVIGRGADHHVDIAPIEDIFVLRKDDCVVIFELLVETLLSLHGVELIAVADTEHIEIGQERKRQECFASPVAVPDEDRDEPVRRRDGVVQTQHFGWEDERGRGGRHARQKTSARNRFWSSLHRELLPAGIPCR